MSKSMSGTSRWILLLAREPLKHSNADLSNAKDTLALIQDIILILILLIIIIIILILILIPGHTNSTFFDQIFLFFCCDRRPLNLNAVP